MPLEFVRLSTFDFLHLNFLVQRGADPDYPKGCVNHDEVRLETTKLSSEDSRTKTGPQFPLWMVNGHRPVAKINHLSRRSSAKMEGHKERRRPPSAATDHCSLLTAH